MKRKKSIYFFIVFVFIFALAFYDDGNMSEARSKLANFSHCKDIKWRSKWLVCQHCQRGKRIKCRAAFFGSDETLSGSIKATSSASFFLTPRRNPANWTIGMIINRIRNLLSLRPTKEWKRRREGEKKNHLIFAIMFEQNDHRIGTRKKLLSPAIKHNSCPATYEKFSLCFFFLLVMRKQWSESSDRAKQYLWD